MAGIWLFQFRLLFVILLPVSLSVSGQFKWDGEGGDGQWINRFNWIGDRVPDSSDHVLLDHTYILEKYSVFLPAGTTTIRVESIRIDAGKDSILLTIPRANTAVPALTLLGAGYGLHIGNTGVFINASGASSGQPLQIADSIRIDNGGMFIHRTSRSHANIVMVLSIASGTETGIFKFDIPDASATISLSDRNFGSLHLSAHSSPGKINYTASGTKEVHVRGDFTIDSGVTVSLNFSDTLFIDGNYIQNGGILNCATSTRAVVIAIAGDVIQSMSGIITESGSVNPCILLNGTKAQMIKAEGSFQNQVVIGIKNAGSILLAPFLVPYQLKLISGIVKTASTSLLILLPGSEIISDSTKHTSFIEGPLKKMGIDSSKGFLFPVGRNGVQRWVRMRNCSGNLTAEFIMQNPQYLSNRNGNGLHHISSLEYWSLVGDPMTNSKIELSFDNVNSGGVTELASLRVAQLAEGQWIDAGNSATTGNAGSNGSVVSDLLIGQEPVTRYFTLAAANAQNPLPFANFQLKGSVIGKKHFLEWIFHSDVSVLYFVVESSDNFFLTHEEKRIEANSTQSKYSFENQIAIDQGHLYYRVRAEFPAGKQLYSRVIVLRGGSPFIKLRKTGTQILIDMMSSQETDYHLQLQGTDGRLLHTNRLNLGVGPRTIYVDMELYPRGIYYLIIMNATTKKVFTICW